MDYPHYGISSMIKTAFNIFPSPLRPCPALVLFRRSTFFVYIRSRLATVKSRFGIIFFFIVKQSSFCEKFFIRVGQGSEENAIFTNEFLFPRIICQREREVGTRRNHCDENRISCVVLRGSAVVSSMNDILVSGNYL